MLPSASDNRHVTLPLHEMPFLSDLPEPLNLLSPHLTFIWPRCESQSVRSSFPLCLLPWKPKTKKNKMVLKGSGQRDLEEGEEILRGDLLQGLSQRPWAHSRHLPSAQEGWHCHSGNVPRRLDGHIYLQQNNFCTMELPCYARLQASQDWSVMVSKTWGHDVKHVLK